MRAANLSIYSDTHNIYGGKSIIAMRTAFATLCIQCTLKKQSVYTEIEVSVH